MCQSCVDQNHISQSAYDLIELFNQVWPDAEFGPAHVVLSDANVNDHCLQLAREGIVNALCDDAAPHRKELTATLALLEMLSMQPEIVRAPAWAKGEA